MSDYNAALGAGAALLLGSGMSLDEAVKAIKDLLAVDRACREMPTRSCPEPYGDGCGDRPCARFESEDEAPWRPEVQG